MPTTSTEGATLAASAGVTAGRGTHAVGGGMVTRFLAASGISFYGDWLTTVALVVLLFRVTGSATGPALYILVRVAPRVLGPVPGGVFADRMGPVRIAVACATAQGMLTAAIALFAHYRIVPLIYVAVAGAQFLNSLSQPAYGALIPRLAPKERLGRINGIYSSLFASSILVSPAIGALVLPHATPELLIIVDAASFLVAAALLATLHPAEPQEPDLHSAKGIGAGVPIVLRDGMLRSLAFGYLANTAVITALQAVLVVAASQHFGRDIYVGWLYAAVGAGGLIGAVPVIRRTPLHVGRVGIVVATLAELIPVVLFVMVTNLAIAMVLLLLSSLAGTIYQTRGWVGLQQRVAPDLLGRTTAVIRFSMYIGMLFGAVAAATMVQTLGWQATVLIVSAVCFLLLVASAVSGPDERPAEQLAPIDWPPL